MIQACTYHSAIFVKPQQWPTPSESIAIYCVRKLVLCVTHLQSCTKVDIWNKKKRLRTVAKIKTQDYKNWRLQKLSTIATPPLNTATTLFNEHRSHTSDGASRLGLGLETNFCESRFRSRSFWWSLGLVSKLQPGLSLGLETNFCESRFRSRSFWWSLGLVSKLQPGLSLGLQGYGLDYIAGLNWNQSVRMDSGRSFNEFLKQEWNRGSFFH